jgi:threonine dehydrogenase-like Zn-dependent dehydrogenase
MGGTPATHTIDWVLHFLETSTLPVSDLITHRMKLDQYRQAIRANLHRDRSGAIKTIFDFR